MRDTSCTIGYGDRELAVRIPQHQLLMELKANDVPVPADPDRLIREAIACPIGSGTLDQIVRPGETVAIIVSDITRPSPSHLILPPLLDALNTAGIADDSIEIIFALGIHRPHTREEQERLVGSVVYQRIRCFDSDPADIINFGSTPLGTPVNITRRAAQADHRILTGNIEFHYFAGYSGGAKALMPGVSDRAAIQANHSRMVETSSRAGAIDDNRLRLDLEAALDLCPCPFIVNVVLDEQKRIVGAFAGDHRLAHRAGCRCLDQLYRIEIPRLADLVIATPGGLPKDINLYQTQKALDNAKYAVRPGGIIILAGQCREGYGEAVFARWLESTSQPSDLISRIHREFELGGHKAAAIAMVLENADVWLYSDLPDTLAKQTGMRPVHDLQTAIDDALEHLGPDARVIVMPHAGSTLPSVSPSV
ncbi:MAG: nickel-dependent lactate racemase [Eubacteriales bacterium]|nr:nickel-dependent lactate racemase [Eubacteriales bacterium]